MEWWEDREESERAEGKIDKSMKAMHTFSIALLVRPPLDPLLSFLALGVDAFFCYAVFDAAETGTSIVTLLAGLLTIGAGILDLPAFRACGLRWHHTRWKRVHMHGDTGVSNGMHGHRRLN